MIPMSQVRPNSSLDANFFLVSLVNTQETTCCGFRGHAQIVVEGIEHGLPFFRRFDMIRGGKTHFSSKFQKWCGNEEGTIGEIRENGPSQRNYALLESTQWRVPAADANRMMDAIRQERAALEQAKRDGTDKDLFKYQNAGSKRWKLLLGGNGGENCVTWAEKKLAIAGAGNRGVILDSSKASPKMHLKHTQIMTGVALIAAATASVSLVFRGKNGQ